MADFLRWKKSKALLAKCSVSAVIEQELIVHDPVDVACQLMENLDEIKM